jgi:ribosomal RNA assembly protein
MQIKITCIIPGERVGVLIGREGGERKRIEETLGVRLSISGETGTVEITPRDENTDPVSLLRARDIAIAIGRGFSSEKACFLFDEDMVLEFIDLRELYGKNESDIRRVKGRIIGQEGKTRRIIEEMTRANLSIYGDTIGILGGYERVATAREAIEMILRGKQHATVYRFLRDRRWEEKRRQTLELWEKPMPKQ